MRCRFQGFYGARGGLPTIFGHRDTADPCYSSGVSGRIPPRGTDAVPHETALISTIAISLAFAFVGGLIAVRVGLPPLIGYLLAGVAVGPFTPGFVADRRLAGELAEIGVVLLMFGIGMHFSLGDLAAVRRIAVPGALAQIAAAIGFGLTAASLWRWGAGAGVVLGLALGASSTVVLLRALEPRGMLLSDTGQIALAWLVVEDLLMVLALVILPAFAPSLGGHVAVPQSESLWVTLSMVFGKVAAFVALMLAGGARLFPWLLERVVRTGSRELFTLAIIALALGIAFAATSLFGVSLALGAFLAGVVVNNSDHSRRAAIEAQPLQDAFGVLFFVSVGMLFDPATLIRYPLRTVSMLAVVMLGNAVVVFLAVRIARRPVGAGLTIAAGLAQIGEFAFIIAELGARLGLLPSEGQSMILAAAILSITFNPLMFRAAEAIERRAAPA